MKKILLGSFLSVLALVITGCDYGKKGTFTCTMEPVNDLEQTIGEMPSQEITVDYQGKKVKKATLTYIYSTEEVASEKYDGLLEEAKNNGWPTNFKLEGNKITNLSNTDDLINVAISLNDDKNARGKDTVLAGFKAQGYTCK